MDKYIPTPHFGAPKIDQIDAADPGSALGSMDTSKQAEETHGRVSDLISNPAWQN